MDVELFCAADARRGDELFRFEDSLCISAVACGHGHPGLVLFTAWDMGELCLHPKGRNTGASLAGTPGIVFWVGLVASTVAVIIHKGMRIHRPLSAYGLPLFLLLAAPGHGWLRLTGQPQRGTVKIGLTAIDDFIGKKTPPEKVEAAWRGYEKAAAQLANDGARIVILPEKIEAFALNDAERRKAALRRSQRVRVFISLLESR